MHLAFERKHEEFTVIRINFNIVKRDDKEYPYNEDNLYFEFNNAGYHNII